MFRPTRFEYWEGATRICNFLYDSRGRRILIEFYNHPNKEVRVILDASLADDVYGMRFPEEYCGFKCSQEIILIGDLSPDWKRTAGGPHYATATGEKYREFTLQDIKLSFPFARWVQIRNKRWPVEGPIKLKIHFEFNSLFPDGLKVEGQRIELKKLTQKAKSAT